MSEFKYNKVFFFVISMQEYCSKFTLYKAENP